MKIRRIVGVLVVLTAATAQAPAGVMQYGDRNLLGTGTYPSDPTAGATLQGLAPGAVTVATDSYTHPFPSRPAAGTYPGTDQVYTGGPAAPSHDGYTGLSGVVAGPQALSMDYSGLVPAGQKVDSLTLGVAADDFQQPVFHQPFVAKVNGVVDAALSTELNALDLSGPKAQFFSVGINPALLTSSRILSLSIDRPGPGGDGWAVDFATVGVTTSVAPVPEPTALTVLALGLAGIALRSRRRSAVVA